MKDRSNFKRTIITLLYLLLMSYSVYADTIIDNGDNGTSSVGSWSISGADGHYGINSLYNKTASASYSFQASVSNMQEVSLWWTEWPSRATNIPIEIYNSDTLITTAHINQSANGSQWNRLGIYNFTTGLAKIKILGVDSQSVCADAVKFTTIDAGNATLTWDPPEDTPNIAGYQVYYGHNSRSSDGFTDYDSTKYAGNVTIYKIKNLAKGDKYYFAVTTKNTYGRESVYSNEVNCTISTIILPKVPRNLHVTAD